MKRNKPALPCPVCGETKIHIVKIHPLRGALYKALSNVLALLFLRRHTNQCTVGRTIMEQRSKELEVVNTWQVEM